MYRARLPAGAVFSRLKSQLGLQLGSSSLVCIRWVIMWLFLKPEQTRPQETFDGSRKVVYITFWQSLQMLE